MEKPLIDKEYLLQKHPGKGGWTYAEIIEIPQDKSKPFGMVKVKGTIDAFEIKNFNLAPMGNGHLLLPVKTEIRKKIKKQAGEYVKVILFADHSIFTIPTEIIDCLRLDEYAHQKFMILKEKHQKEFIQWIYAAKKEETQANRINAMMDMVTKGKNLYDKKED